MNRILKTLVVTAALAAAASAQAQQYADGDLLVGFAGSGNDFIYDLGSVTSLSPGETWTVGASAGTQFGVVGALFNLTHHLRDHGGSDPCFGRYLRPDGSV